MSLPIASADERVLLQAMANSPIATALMSLDGHWLNVNEALAQFLDYSEAELVQMTFQEVTHPEDLNDELDLLYETLAGQSNSYRIRKRYLRRDGEPVTADLSATLLYDGAGQASCFIVQLVDITEWLSSTFDLQMAGVAVERDRRVMEAILNAVDVAVTFMDPSGKIEMANRQYEEVSALARGLNEWELADATRVTPPAPMTTEDGRPRYVFADDNVTPVDEEHSPLSTIGQSGAFAGERIWVGNHPSTRRALSVSGEVVQGAAGERIGTVLSFKDVTELAKALQVKDEFVASVSHELRTPLTSVLGHLELLVEDDSLSSGTAKAVRVIQRNASRLHMLVGDLLQVLRASDGEVTVRRAEVDVVQVLRDAVEAAKGQAEASEVSLAFSAPDRLTTITDAQRVRQVADNLISNALKYSEPGDHAEVTVAEVGEHVEIRVSDTGLGIDEADHDYLFARFFRSEEAVTRHIQGTGLGLNIVHAIVTALDGEISVKSKKGEGSTFTVLLPAQ